MQDTSPSTFTNEDRKLLITMSVELRQVQKQLEELTDIKPPSRADFAALSADVRALQNFRYWLLGGTAVCGILFGVIAELVFHSVLQHP